MKHGPMKHSPMKHGPTHSPTRRRSARIVALSVAATATALVLSACSTAGGGGSSAAPSGGASSAAAAPTKVTLQLQWVPQAQFAGYYAALANGYYKKEGLDVTIKPAGTDTVPIQSVAKGQADYAISWVPKVLGSIEQGVNVTDVAQIYERSGTTQISMKDKDITSVAALAGKKSAAGATATSGGSSPACRRPASTPRAASSWCSRPSI